MEELLLNLKNNNLEYVNDKIENTKNMYKYYLDYSIYMSVETPTQKFLASKLYTAYEAIYLKDRDNYKFLIENSNKNDKLFIHDCYITACCSDFLECVDYILKNYKVPEFLHGFHCSMKNSPNVFNYLIENYNFPINNNIILQIAIEESTLEIFQILIEYGLDIYTNNQALIQAISSNNLEKVKFLIEKYKLDIYNV